MRTPKLIIVVAAACLLPAFHASAEKATALASPAPAQPTKTGAEFTAMLSNARQLAATGKFADALLLFSRATELAPENYRGHAGRASMLNQLERYGEGHAAIERAIALAPENPMLYYNRGLALAELGRFDAAIADFDKASAGRPELPMPYADRAAARMSLGQLSTALQDCEIALKVDANYIWARYYRAQIRYLQGEFAAAAADFAAVAESQPEFAPTRLWRYVSNQRANAPAAIGELTIPKDGGWPSPLLQHLRNELDAGGLLRKALEQRIVDDERRLSLAHVTIGIKHLISRRPTEARTAFESALTIKVPQHFEQLVARAELARLR